MALLNDQLITCLTDWMAYDTKLTILSEQESTSIEAKSRLAQNEIETQVTGFLLRQSGLSEFAARELLSQIVVTEPLARWHSLLTLSLFYTDIACLQNNTLHRDQARYYDLKADAARVQLFETGIGIVYQPIPKAPLPFVVLAPGANAPRFLRARVRFVSASGAVGALSSEFNLDLTNGETAQLSFASLPANVSGWLLFLGETSDPLYLATTAPVPAGVTVEVTPSLPAIGAPVANPEAQLPDQYFIHSPQIWR
jgi:hypothetical protein